ncbi:MAG: DUF1800 family protein, partial [Janthinobacterium lividum]|nr:DUF1800 family protein [Janthinobacterium lividum]
FNAKDAALQYRIYYLSDPLSGLGQNPMNAPSVFNYFRPSYVPPNSALAAAGLVAPEMQITSEPSVTGYLNFMQDAIRGGVGESRAVRADYTAELALASEPGALLDRIDLLLMSGNMSSRLRSKILATVTSIAIPAASASNAAQVTTAKTYRVHLAIFLAMASPEYLVQK